MRKSLIAIVALAAVLGAQPVTAGAWDEAKQGAHRAKEDIKKAPKQIGKDVAGSAKAGAKGTKKAGKDAWGNVSKSVKNAAD